MNNRSSQYTSASELAQMAVCERQVLLRAKMGDRKTAQQAVAAERGNAVHERIHREGHVPLPCPGQASADKRCFIATAVYGVDAPETICLRRFRDGVLIGTPVGDWIVAIYYRISPPFASFLDRRQGTRAVIKCVLDVLVRVIK